MILSCLPLIISGRNIKKNLLLIVMVAVCCVDKMFFSHLLNIESLKITIQYSSSCEVTLEVSN